MVACEENESWINSVVAIWLRIETKTLKGSMSTQFTLNEGEEAMNRI